MMAKAGIEPATPRVSVVDRGISACWPRPYAAKIPLQIGTLEKSFLFGRTRSSAG